MLAPLLDRAKTHRLGVAPAIASTTPINALGRFLAYALPEQPNLQIVPLAEGESPAQTGKLDGVIVPKEWLEDPHRFDKMIAARVDPRPDKITLVIPLSVTPHGGRATIQRSFGQVSYTVNPNGEVAVDLVSPRPRLPRAASVAAVWPPGGDSPETFRREEIGADLGALGSGAGLIVSRADALPRDFIPPPGTLVIVPGTTTWLKLARRGVTVNGSFDGLGEGEFERLRLAFPHVTRWLKVSHADAPAESTLPLVATYRLVPESEPIDLSHCTHFFWRSGSQFEFYLTRNPHLRTAVHGCGPGHTATTIRRHLIAPGHVEMFLSYDDFFCSVIGKEDHAVR